MEGVELVGASHSDDQEVAVLLGAAEFVLLHLARRPAADRAVKKAQKDVPEPLKKSRCGGSAGLCGGAGLLT